MKKVYLFIVLCLFFAAGIVNAAETKLDKSEQVSIKYKKISAKDATRLMEENTSFILLDVRTEEEHREVRIPGSKLLPLNEIDVRATSELADKNTPIFVYCRSGRRSEMAAIRLVGLGYTNVYDIGGIVDWPYEKE